MKINAQMRLLEDNIIEDKDPQKSLEWANGWVEIEDCIKFPFKIRSYTDKGTGEKKTFVSYPQRKTTDGYVDVIYPNNRDVRKEIENYLLEEMKNIMIRKSHYVPVSNVQITIVENPDVNHAVKLLGYASIQVAGFTINGIQIKEGRNGIFVEMPQHKSNDEYRDTVYATNAVMRDVITREVLWEYEKLMQPKISEQEKLAAMPEQEENKTADIPSNDDEVKKSIEQFITAYQNSSTGQMRAVLKDSTLEMDPEIYMENRETVKMQIGMLDDGESQVIVRFFNDYEPEKHISPGGETIQQIEVGLYYEGTLLGKRIIEERQSQSPEEAKKNYGQMLDIWKDITHPDIGKAPRYAAKQDKVIPSIKM